MIRGFTTGTCAQAAAKGACLMLTGGRIIDTVSVRIPAGEEIAFRLVDQSLGENFARCAVIKDSGDDPDVTNGARIFAEVRLAGKKGLSIKGGDGVGKITKPGLSLGVGEWAINPVPRSMIERDLAELLPKDKGAEVIISVPGGEGIAKKTYNPKLGIKGGISIIGTTGIVEPKSLDAYKASLSLEIDVLKAQGHDKAVLVFGYVGERFCRENLKIQDDLVIKIGDHVGFILKKCAEKKMKEILLIGHIGKLIKVAGGQFNTNYRFGDKRINLIAHHARALGASRHVVKDILSQTTAEATINILNTAGLANVFERIAKDAREKMRKLVNNKLKIGCIVLSLKGEVLGRS